MMFVAKCGLEKAKSLLIRTQFYFWVHQIANGLITHWRRNLDLCVQSH